MRGNRRVTMLAGGALLLLPLLSGCKFNTNLDNPAWAKLTLSASSTFPLELLLSQKFLVTETSVQLMESTTDTISVPFEKTYTLDSPARLYVQLTNVGQGSVSFRVRVVMEEKTWMNEDRTLGPGEKMEFVYRYDTPTPNY